MALIRCARATFRTSRIRILHSRRPPRDKCVLPIINRMCPCVTEAEVKSAGHTATDRDSQPVIHARGRTLELIDRPELRARDAKQD